MNATVGLIIWIIGTIIIAAVLGFLIWKLLHK